MALSVAGVRKKCVRTCEQAAVERRDACQAFRWIARPKECISGTAVVRQSTSMPPTVSQERASWQGGEQPAPGLHADARCEPETFSLTPFPPFWVKSSFDRQTFQPLKFLTVDASHFNT